MRDKRKSLNKQNTKPLKKSFNNILLLHNYTEDLRLPTNATIELRNEARSIQLKRTYLLPPKKNISRKARSKSVKQSTPHVRNSPHCPLRSATQHPLRFRNILQQFKELKLEHDRSKSKSLSCKSKSAHKKQLKKHLSTTLRTNPQDDKSKSALTSKLQRTLKRLNDEDYFKEDEDLIPLVSSSDVFQREQLEILSDNEEDVNLNEIRQYYSTLTFKTKSGQLCRSNLYKAMAIVIQRAWRRFRTKKLIKNYICFFQNERLQELDHSERLESQEIIQDDEIIVPSEQFYHDNIHRLRITQISNLGDSELEDNKKEERIDEILNRDRDNDNDNIQNTIVINEEQGMQKDKPYMLKKGDDIQQRGENIEERCQQMTSGICQETERGQEDTDCLKDQSYEEAVKRIKYEELQKWDQIISLISVNRSDNPDGLKQLLTALADQSEFNKKDLELKANLILTYTSRNNFDEEEAQSQRDTGLKEFTFEENAPQIAKIARQSQGDHSNSDHSERQKEEYDSKKYIEYLQGDRCILNRQKSSSSSQNSHLPKDRHSYYPTEKLNSNCLTALFGNNKLQGNKRHSSPQGQHRTSQGQYPSPQGRISKQKQDAFLQELKKRPQTIKFGIDCLYKSESEKTIPTGKNNQLRSRIKKSISEKQLVRQQTVLSSGLSDEDMNLQLLTREFLEGTDPMENIQILKSEQKLMIKFAELSQLRREDELLRGRRHCINKTEVTEDLREEEFSIDQLTVQEDIKETERRQQEINGQQYFKYSNRSDHNFQDKFQSRLRQSESKKIEGNKFRQMQDGNEREPQAPQLSLQLQKETQLRKEQVKTKQSEKDHSKEHKKSQSQSESQRSLQQIDKMNESDSQSSRNEDQQQKQGIAMLILNILLFETLKEIAKYEFTILRKFKEYSLSIKSRRKEVEGRNRGFATSPSEIRYFLDTITKYVVSQKFHVFYNLEIPNGPTALDMLKYMHSQSDESDDYDDDINTLVLPVQVFYEYWKLRERTIMDIYKEEKTDSKEQRLNFQYIRDLNNIFCHCMFDAYNECLDLERNFGSLGRTFPWKKSPVFFHRKSQKNIQTAIANAQQRLLRLSFTYCGIIVDKEIYFLQGNEEYMQQMQESRLLNMIIMDLEEQQPRWIFYDDQEAETLVEMSEAIYLEIIMEMVQDLWDLSSYGHKTEQERKGSRNL